jgi:hypothetical protein
VFLQKGVKRPANLGGRVAGNRVFNQMTRVTQAQKAAIVLSNEIVGMIVGMLEVTHILNFKARMQVHLGNNSFANHLRNLFDSHGIVGATPRENSTFLEKNGKTYLSYSISTFTLPFFSWLHNLWYIKVEGRNIKVLPSNLAELLTPVALAYWIAVDGCLDKSQGAIQIATNSLSLAEVDQLRSIL